MGMIYWEPTRDEINAVLAAYKEMCEEIEAAKPPVLGLGARGCGVRLASRIPALSSPPRPTPLAVSS